MRKDSRSSITTSTLRRVIVACLLMFTLVSVLAVLKERDARFRAAHADANRNVAQNLGAISLALWNYDIDGMKAIMAGLTRTGSILRIEVSDIDGEVAAVGRDDGAWNVENHWQSDLSAPDGHQKIGTLRVLESYDEVRHDLVRTTIALVVSELVKILGLAAILFLLIYRTITRQLVKLSKQVGKLHPDDAKGSVVLDRRPHRPDELDDLVDSINSFHLQRVEERLARQQAESEARQRLEELARMGRVAVVQSLSSSIAHELNQPLGAILSNAEAAEIVLANPAVDADLIREIVTDIRAEAARAANIIGRLRALIAKRSVSMAMIDLNELILETRDWVSFQVGAESVTLDLELGTELPPVLGDKVQLQQVIFNLLANGLEAVKARPDRRVKIRTSRVEGGAVSVSICDNGPGIPDDQLDEIFSPFYTTKLGGTGMGLWISHMIVEQHGGKLKAITSDEGGACLVFSLPSAAAE